MPIYEVTIGRATYRVESARPLTDAEAYQAARGQHETYSYNGYAKPEDQAALAAGGVEAGGVPGDRIQPVPGYTGPTSVPQVGAQPSLADENARLGRLAAVRPRVPVAAAGQEVPDGLGDTPSEMNRGETASNGPVSKETLYGLGGAVGGGLLGAFGGPLVSALGGTAGSALGTYYGRYQDEIAKGATPEDARAAARDAAGLDIAWSAAGGLVFKLGGKVVRFAANTEAAKRLASKLGFQTAPTPAGSVIDPRQGELGGLERVFPGTTAAEARDAQQTALAEIQRRSGVGVTQGQISGKPGVLEQQARAGAQDIFGEARAKLNQVVEDGARQQRDVIGGRDMDPVRAAGAAGSKVQAVLSRTEEIIKGRHGATFSALSDPAGPLGAAGGSFSSAKIKAIALKEQAVAGISAEERTLLKEIVDRLPDNLTLAEAHQHVSAWRRAAEAARKPGQADSPVVALYTRLANAAREGFDDTLANAASSGKIAPDLKLAIEAARRDYREMHEVLFSDGLVKAARVNPEDVLQAITTKGSVTEIAELQRAVALAQRQGDSALSKDARAAVRNLRAEYFSQELNTAEKFASLPGRLQADDKFRRTFELMFPNKADQRVIERLSAAAQIANRTVHTGGANTGLVSGMAATAGAAAGSLGGPVGAAMGALLGFGAAGAGRRALAHAMTKPTLRDKLPVVSAYALALANGSAPVVVPQTVAAFLAELKEDGYDLTQGE